MLLGYRRAGSVCSPRSRGDAEENAENAKPKFLRMSFSARSSATPRLRGSFKRFVFGERQFALEGVHRGSRIRWRPIQMRVARPEHGAHR